MAQKSAESFFREGALRLALPMGDGQVVQFLLYLEALKQWNRRLNLTSRTGETAIIERHFLDSLMGAKGFEAREGLKLLDMGAGAGFPGLPLKLHRPGTHLTLVESVHKKTAFLHHICGILGLQGVFVLPERVEALHHQPEHQRAYDVITARAFARPVLTREAAIPLLVPGGRILLYLTPAGAEELRPEQGWELKRLDYVLPFSGAKRTLMVITHTGSSHK